MKYPTLSIDVKVDSKALLDMLRRRKKEILEPTDHTIKPVNSAVNIKPTSTHNVSEYS